MLMLMTDTDILDYLEKNFDMVQVHVTGDLGEDPMEIFADGWSIGYPQSLRYNLIKSIKEGEAKLNELRKF